jgi:hypothetical protein
VDFADELPVAGDEERLRLALGGLLLRKEMTVLEALATTTSNTS